MLGYKGLLDFPAEGREVQRLPNAVFDPHTDRYTSFSRRAQEMLVGEQRRNTSLGLYRDTFQLLS